MLDHDLCATCRRADLSLTESMKIEINPSRFIAFMKNVRGSSTRMSEMERSAIAVLESLGIGLDMISLLTHRDERTVSSWLDKFETDYCIQDRPRSGRPPITTIDQNNEIISLAQDQPFFVPRGIKHELDLQVSVRTVRRILDKAGIHGRVARKDYVYTADHVQQRLEFAQSHQSWTVDQWSHVAFADEAWIHLGQNGQLWVQRPVE